VKVAVLESEDSRAQRREAEPLRLADGRKIGRDTLQILLAGAQAQLAAIASGIGLPVLLAERAELETRRSGADLWKDPRSAADLLEACDQIDRVIERLDRLQRDQAEFSAALTRSAEREELTRLAERLQRHAGYVAQAHRELLAIGGNGYGNALIEIAPIGRARPARDLLYGTYMAWAEHRKHRVLIVREPMTDDEPAMIAVIGPYAFGYLRGEAGHHRLRTGNAAGPVILSVQRALKQVGQFGGRVRSRVELAGGGFVVQNAGSLAENRELAAEFASSWASVAENPEIVVRRYDLEPFLVRDFLTGISTGRADTLHAEPFHKLLCDRIDAGPVGAR
jgi:hypothetical protein